MTDIGPYGVHQHASPDAVRLHTLVGEPAGHVTFNQVVGTSPASFSTAPFKGGPKVKPKRKLTPVERDRLGRCIGKENTCKVRPIHGTELCWFHTQQKARRDSHRAP